MALPISTVNVRISAKDDTSRGVASAIKSLSSLSTASSNAGSFIGAALGGAIGGAVGGIVGPALLSAVRTSLEAVRDLIAYTVSQAADLETSQTKFKVLTGSASEALDVINRLRAVDLKSPLRFKAFTDGAQVMLSFGMSAEDVTRDMEALSEIAGADEEKMRSLVLAFSQSAAAGRLMGQDLVQMVNAGFNPLKYIADATGRSVIELRKKMEEGVIPFEVIRVAFRNASLEGGRFFGMNDEASKTLTGSWFALRGNIDLLAQKIGAALLPLAKEVLGVFSELVDIGKELADSPWLKFFDHMHLSLKLVNQGLLSMKMAMIEIGVIKGPDTLDEHLRLMKQLHDAGLIKLDQETLRKIGEFEKSLKAKPQDLAAITEDAIKKAEAEKRLEELRKQAEQLKEKLRTPQQVFDDAVLRAAEMFKAGLIPEDIFHAAVARAGDELDEATKRASDNLKVGALLKNTSAAFSAVQEARRGEADRKAAEQRAIEQRARANELLQKIAVAVEKPVLAFDL